MPPSCSLHTPVLDEQVASVASIFCDNLDIEINGPEIPLFDGSAKYFISMINSAGIKDQDDKYKLLKLKKFSPRLKRLVSV